MATYPWLDDRIDERTKWDLSGGPLDGKTALLTDGTSAVMWIGGFYGRYKRTKWIAGVSLWEPMPWFGQLASK